MFGITQTFSVLWHWIIVCSIFHVCLVSSYMHPPVNQSAIQEYLDEEKKIADGLLNESYDKRFIPASPGNPLKVKLELVIADVLKLDDKKMEIEMIIYVRQRWHDYRISWNSSVKKIKVREHFFDKIWLPDIRIINMKDMKRFEGFGGINMNIYSSGLVYFSQLALVVTSCPMDLRNFPLDRQSCFLNFSSFAYANSLLTFALTTKQVAIRHFHLPQFEFVDAKKIIEENQKKTTASKVTLALTFHRRSVYYIIQIYIPSMFLVVLSWLGFLMKSTDIADRVALQITMVLSIVVLHGGTNASLPPVSYAKASDWFVIVSFGFIFVALLETMLVYRISLLIKRRETKRNLSASSSRISKQKSNNEMVENALENNVQNEIRPSFSHEYQNAVVVRPAPWDLPAFVNKVSLFVFPMSYFVYNICYWQQYGMPH